MSGADLIGYFGYHVLGPLFLAVTATIGAFVLALVIVLALRDTVTAD